MARTAHGEGRGFAVDATRRRTRLACPTTPAHRRDGQARKRTSRPVPCPRTPRAPSTATRLPGALRGQGSLFAVDTLLRPGLRTRSAYPAPRRDGETPAKPRVPTSLVRDPHSLGDRSAISARSERDGSGISTTRRERFYRESVRLGSRASRKYRSSYFPPTLSLLLISRYLGKISSICSGSRNTRVFLMFGKFLRINPELGVSELEVRSRSLEVSIPWTRYGCVYHIFWWTHQLVPW